MVVDIYINNILIFKLLKKVIFKLKKYLDIRFKMKYLSNIFYYLGMTITRDCKNRII